MKAGYLAGCVVTVVLSAAGLLALQGCAEEPKRTAESPKTTIRASAPHLSDANILSLLALANKSDIEGGRLAQEKATSPDVKAFASRMVGDHAALLEQGTELSERLGLVPVQPEIGHKLVLEHNRAMETLKHQSGSEFDRMYIEHEVGMHRKVLDLVEQAKRTADEPRLKQHLEQVEPLLHEHLSRGISRGKGIE